MWRKHTHKKTFVPLFLNFAWNHTGCTNLPFLPSSFCFYRSLFSFFSSPSLPFPPCCAGDSWMAANGRVESPQPLSASLTSTREEWCSATETRSWGGTTGNKKAAVDGYTLAPDARALLHEGREHFLPRIKTSLIRWAPHFFVVFYNFYPLWKLSGLWHRSSSGIGYFFFFCGVRSINVRTGLSSRAHTPTLMTYAK